MQKLKSVLALLLLVCLLTSCYTVQLSAPYKSSIQLASSTDNLPFKTKHKCWYFMYGAIPINKNVTANSIRNNGLKTVRIETKFTASDFLINFLVGMFGFSTNTVVIEGSTESNEKENIWKDSPSERK